MNLNRERYWQIVDGELKSLRADGLTRFLVNRANEWIDLLKTRKPTIICFENYTKEISYEYLNKYLEGGFTKSFLREINGDTAFLKHRILLVPSKKSSKPEVIEALDINLASPREEVLYPLVSSIKSGNLNFLKRCKNEDCTIFFLGRSNKKWCSDKCGAKQRIKKHRKKRKTQKYS